MSALSRAWARGLPATLTVLVWGATAAQATAQVSSDAHLAEYQACPPGGMQLSFSMAPRSGGRMGPISAAVHWAGEPGWIDKPLALEKFTAPETWVRPGSQLESHLALWSRAGRSMPQSQSRILIFEESDHWTHVLQSRVAVRDVGGAWQVFTVREINASEPSPDRTVEQGRLDAADSARLDGILADHCLALEPFQAEVADIVSSTDARWTLEIEGLGPTLRIAGRDSGFGRAGGVALLLNHAHQDTE